MIRKFSAVKSSTRRFSRQFKSCNTAAVDSTEVLKNFTKPVEQNPSAVKSDDVFNVQKGLENIEIYSLSKISSENDAVKRKYVYGPNKVFNSLGWDISKYGYKMEVDVSSYTFDSLQVGDVVEFVRNRNTNDIGTSLISGLVVVADVPKDTNDDFFTFLTSNGELFRGSKNQVKFRLPKLFEPKLIRDGLVVSPGTNLDILLLDKRAIIDDYITVPKDVRKVISTSISKITNQAKNFLSVRGARLELVHKILVMNGIETVSIFELYRMLKFGVDRPLIDKAKSLKGSPLDVLEMALKSMKSSPALQNDRYVQKLGTHAVLGRSTSDLSVDSKYDATILYAIHLLTLKQSNLWAVAPNKISKSPLMYEVLDIEQRKKSAAVLKVLTDNFDTILQDIERKVQDSNFNNSRHLKMVTDVLRDYCSDNIRQIELLSLVINLLRKLPSLQHVDVVSKTTAYWVLEKLESNENAVDIESHLWSNFVKIPYSKHNSSEIADREQEYFDFCAADTLLEEDPLQGLRHDFGDMPVYCIDSETAHEIDDGVSIERISPQKWLVHVHIADPASYISPDSTLAHIAYKRAATVYLNDIVVPMLPKVVSQIAGLGVNGQKTRTMTYTVAFNPQTKSFDRENATIRGGIVKHFPENTTYKNVDKILSSEGSDTYTQDLKDLYQVSKALREERLHNGALLLDDKDNTYELLDAADGVEIVKSHQPKSVLLVTELMILANCVAGDFFHKNKIPGVFRNLNDPIGYQESVYENKGNKKDVINALLGKEVPFDKFAKVFSSLQVGYYENVPKSHKFLGLTRYNPSTSPLRRFGDLVGHWQTHKFIKGENYYFSDSHLKDISMYLTYRSQIIKDSQRDSVFHAELRKFVKYLNNGQESKFDNGPLTFAKSDRNKFPMVLTHVHIESGIGILLEPYKFSVTLPYETSGEHEVGDIVMVKIDTIDPIEKQILVSRWGPNV